MINLLGSVSRFSGHARVSVRKRRSRAQQPCVNRLEVRALLAYFQGLGANTTATDVSANGSVVVGNVTNQGPFYWTQGNGVVLLRDSSGNILGDLYKATSVSGDGSVIVGGNPTPGFAFAFRWANGVAALIPQLKGIVSTANSVSTDGTIIAGDISQTGSNPSGFTLTGTNLEIIPPSSLNLTTSGTIMSANGAVVAGNVANGIGQITAFQWQNGALTKLPGYTEEDSTATAVSPDGSVVVGSVDSVGLNPQPYEWTNGVVTPLTLPSGFTDGTALGVSNDGTAIVGFMMPPLSTENKAFIWTQANGVQNLQQVLQQVLTADGLGSELTGWTLTEATAITADGNTIVGNGVDPQGQDEGWIANLSTLPPPSSAGTVTTLQASTQNPIYGQPITLTATVGAAAGASGTPTGSVTFQDGLMTLGSAPLYNGMASLTISSLPVGIYSITANYSGNAQFNDSSSAADIAAVQPDATGVTITSLADPAALGQPVTFVVTVSPVAPGGGTPGGTVTFMDASTPLGTTSLIGGQATFTSSNLTVGSHAITAIFSGDADFLASTSAPVTQTVESPSLQFPTRISATANPRPATLGRQVTLTATVKNLTHGGGTPGGSVTFLDGTTSLGSAVLRHGKAMVKTSSLPLGRDVIEVAYTASQDFVDSTGVIIETVRARRSRSKLRKSLISR